MTDQGTSEYFRTKFMQPLVSAMDENGYNLFMLCVPKDEENDLPILIDGNVTIMRAKVIIMNIQTGNNLFIPLFRRPCLISCETLSVKLPLAPFEFKYNLLINCSSIIDLDHWRELFTKQNQLKSYASGVMRCVLSSYGVSIGDSSFPAIWLRKCRVKDFDPVIQV